MKNLLKLTLFGALSVTLFSFTLFKNEGDIIPIDVGGVNFNINQAPVASPVVAAQAAPQVNITVNNNPPPPATAQVSLPQTLSAKGEQLCDDVSSEYECQRLALIYAERNLAERIKTTLSAVSNVTRTGSQTHLTETVMTQAQAILRNREIVREGMTNGRYVYELQAEVEAF
jgi:hypothetical protein